MYPKVSIIILNWNGKGDTIECLESLKHVTYPNYEILVVDNGSTDDSVKCFREQFLEIEIIENEKNLGFAEGNNVGIRRAIDKADYVLLLNNDTVVDPEFLGELVNVSERDPKIGIAGPKIYYYEYKGNKNIVWSRGGKINWWFPLHYHSGFRNVGNDIEKDKIQNVDYIPGTCILIKTEILEYITLPTDYFMQYEDLDFCQQVMKMNYSCVYVPTSKIWHKISASYKKPKLKCFQMKMSFRNSIIFYNKFVSKQRFVIIVLGLILIKLPIIVSYQIFKAKNRSALNCALEGMKEGVMAVMKK